MRDDAVGIVVIDEANTGAVIHAAASAGAAKIDDAVGKKRRDGGRERRFG